MNTHHHDETTKVIHGDCIETMNAMPPESVDAIVTDPPYGLGFMGRKWDGLPPSLEWAEACFRVLKPGGHIAAFGGTRTWHRLAVAIEDAGFEMRDSLAWLYGSGFPKSHDVSKAIDKARDEDKGPTRVVAAYLLNGLKASPLTQREAEEHLGLGFNSLCNFIQPKRKSFGVPRWELWQDMKRVIGLGDDMDAEVWRLNGRKGTLGDNWQNAEVVGIKKGAMSGWNMDGTTKFVDREEKAPATPEAAQWDGWGTALKPAFEPIVLARKPLAEKTVARNVLTHGTGAINIDATRVRYRNEADRRQNDVAAPGMRESRSVFGGGLRASTNPSGRWPANVLLDQHAAAWVDEQSGTSKSNVRVSEDKDEAGATFALGRSGVTPRGHTDSGGASRFFYTAKAPKRERPNVDGIQHPTVKPLAIMEWLISLVTPPGGVLLDPFAGSGTTLEAARKLGHKSIGIEAEETYLPLIDQRLQRSNTNPIELEGIGE